MYRFIILCLNHTYNMMLQINMIIYDMCTLNVHWGPPDPMWWLYVRKYNCCLSNIQQLENLQLLNVHLRNKVCLLWAKSPVAVCYAQQTSVCFISE